jgi:hypothetical protein
VWHQGSWTEHQLGGTWRRWWPSIQRNVKFCINSCESKLVFFLYMSKFFKWNYYFYNNQAVIILNLFLLCKVTACHPVNKILLLCLLFVIVSL